MMSRYELRGTVGFADEPDPYADPNSPGSLSTDYHWEYGYDPGGFTYYAQLYDDIPDEDLDENERIRPLIWIGAIPCSVDTMEQLQREMGFDLPTDEVEALRKERDDHFAGRLRGESAGEAGRRWAMLREIEFRHYLNTVHVYLPK